MMPDSQLDPLIEVLSQVLLAAENEREDVLGELCAGDEALRREVESLLEHRHAADMLFASPLLHHERLGADAPFAPTPEDPCPPGFRLIRVIGQGASGVVYLAQQTNPRRLVAIKVLRTLSLSSDMARRMLAEAHLLARLEHPSIVRVYQAGVLESRLCTQPYLVMEYVEGTDLATFLKSKAATLSVRSQIFTKTCEAVEFAHQRGIIHRDLKPSNVLIARADDGDIQIKLIDFGIAKVLDQASIPIEVRTLDGAKLGTLRYMSPERLAGRCGGGTVASDVYSLGMLASDLFLCPSDPRSGFSPLTARQQRCLAKAIDAMVAPAPSRRASSALKAALAIQSAQHGKAPKPTRPARRTAAVCVGLGAICVATGAISGGTRDGEHVAPRDIAREGAMLRVMALSDDLEEPEAAASMILSRLQYAGSLLVDGQVEEALELHLAVLDLMQSTDDLPVFVTAQAHIGRGYALVKTGRFDEARHAYRQAQAALNFDELGNDNRIAHSWAQIANGRRACGDHDFARRLFGSLITHDHFDRWSWLVRTTILSTAGGLEWLDRNYTEAEALLRRAVDERFDDSDDKRVLKRAAYQASLAVVLRSRVAFDESDRLLQSAVAQHVALRSPTEPAARRYMQHLATNRLLQGDYETAIRVAENMRRRWDANTELDAAQRAYCDFVVGSALLGLGDPESSAARLLEARDGIPSFGIDARRLRARVDNALAVALVQTGDRIEGGRLLAVSTQDTLSCYGPGHPWAEIAESRLSVFEAGSARPSGSNSERDE